MNNEMDNVRSPFFEFNDFTSASKINSFFLFVCFFVCLKNNSIVQLNLFVYKRTQFVQLAGIWLTIQHSSKYLFGLLKIRPDFVLTGGVVIFGGMSVLACTVVFHDVVSLGSMIYHNRVS